MLGIAERFGKWPHEVLKQPAELLKLLHIEAAGRDDDGKDVTGG